MLLTPLRAPSVMKAPRRCGVPRPKDMKRQALHGQALMPHSTIRPKLFLCPVALVQRLSSNDASSQYLSRCLPLQVLQEHVRVFEMNNAIISDIPVRTRDAVRAVQRILPPELILAACATVFALLMMWVSPKIIEAVKVWEGGSDAAYSVDADAVDAMHTRSSEL